MEFPICRILRQIAGALQRASGDGLACVDSLAGDLQLENSIMKWLGVYSLLSSAAALASVLVHLRLSMSTHAQRTLDAASMDLDIKKKS